MDHDPLLYQNKEKRVRLWSLDSGENYFWYDGTKANSYEAGYYIGEYAGWEIYYPADSYVDNGEWG